MSELDFKLKIDFIMLLARSLHRCGAAAHHLERALMTASSKLGLDGQFLALPTGILGTISSGEKHHSFVLRDHPGPIDLSRLARLDNAADHVIDGRQSLAVGMQTLQAIRERKEDYPPALRMLAYALASGGMVTSLQGSWTDLIIAFLIGLIVGAIDAFGLHREALDRLFGALASFIATAGAIGLAAVIPGISPDIVILSSIIVLIPGLALVVSFVELSTKNLIAGTTRLMGAFGELLKIVFTIALAKKVLANWTPHSAGAAAYALPEWSSFFGVIALAIGFIILFRVRPKHFLSAFFVSISSYAIAKFGGIELGTELAFFVAGAWVAIISNVLARALKRPGLITLLPGIILIVPGSINYRGFTSMFQYNVIDTISTVFSVVIIAVSIVAGLFFGATVVPPRRSL